MDELWNALMRPLKRILSVAVIACIGLLIVVRVAEALLPRLAHTAAVFIASPAGLVLVVLAWWWLRRRRK